MTIENADKVISRATDRPIRDRVFGVFPLVSVGSKGDRSKSSLLVLPTFPARRVNGVLVEGCCMYLECALRGVIDGFGQYSLIVGDVVRAAAHEDARPEGRSR